MRVSGHLVSAPQPPKFTNADKHLGESPAQETGRGFSTIRAAFYNSAVSGRLNAGFSGRGVACVRRHSLPALRHCGWPASLPLAVLKVDGFPWGFAPHPNTPHAALVGGDISEGA